MKKLIIIIVVVISFLLVIDTKAKSKLSFHIYYDQKTQMTYELKYQVQKRYNELVSGIVEKQYEEVLKDNIQLFQFKNTHAYYDDGLIIIEGDGKGKSIEGELIAYSICVPQVKPRSIFLELFETTK